MRFDFSDEVQGKWFDFFESKENEDGTTTFLDPKEGDGKVCFRRPPPDVLEGIYSQTRKNVEKIVRDPVSKAMVRIKDYDQTSEQKAREMELFWDYSIQDWEGINDAAGNPAQCTTENKNKVMTRSIRFIRFAGQCMKLLSEVESITAEDSGKN